MTESAQTIGADAIVVGSGVIGSAVAYELVRGGRDVLVLDKGAGAGFGSTSASSAVIRFLCSTYDTIATSWEAKFMWEQWAEHLGLEPAEVPLARFHRTGGLHLDVPIVPVEPSMERLDAVGVPFTRLGPEEIAARFPHVDVGAYWPNKSITDDAFWADATASLGAIYTPDAGYVDDPRLAADNLVEAARRRGARTVYRAEVVAADRVGDVWRLGLADGRRAEAPVVVNAAGPWSGGFNRLAGVGEEFAIGVRPLRQEVHQVSQPAGYGTDEAPGPAVFDIDLGTYMRPGPAGAWVVGGTEPECDPFEWLDSPDDVNAHVTRERYDAQVTRAARRLPELRVPNQPAGVVGVYDVADDWTPIYDRTDADGFYVAMGTSGNQFKNAPIAGRFLAAIVSAVEEGHDHDADPVVYTGEHTGLKIDLGAFSRKRPVNESTTRTVLG
ncbi:NAD(P)/FAD-dependent oxidoreductase [Nocardioides albus]|uniref:Glycine/D-amino acid oxidase-like deaminating enzyme n=1 Tax=Nocardioides albus TaxID=1841 RepID=A0A7W5FBD1_9ACTN|nr:FAD-dependent oxidoreductase [Nocardioides albus]MBB3092051.1 glycine/D-amino acid oxidase-like deaminating enzyme [Nocardioides albus]GGU43491.1 FAD-dependent oxidoreductase [Nocardioides albus]